MINYKLIQLYKQSIITSNDNIQNNDFCFYEEKTEIFKVKEVKKKGVISTENDYYSGSKKIIAGIQSLFDINYTVLSAEDKIKIGILDNIEEIRMKDMPDDYYPPKNIANVIWGSCFKYADIESNNIREKINETCFMIEKIHSIEKLCNSELMFTENIKAEHILYMGDDVPDLEVMKMVELPCCPADASRDILDISKYISPYNGGQGCVRDVLEKVLRLHNKWL